MCLASHGGTAFIPWNTVNVGGLPIDRFEEQFGLSRPVDRDLMIRAVKESGLDIIELKGYTSSGIALTACRVVSAIVFNAHAVLPLSVIPEGEYGLRDVAMSLPCVLGEKGVERILTLPLDKEAERDLHACDTYLRGVIRQVDTAMHASPILGEDVLAAHKAHMPGGKRRQALVKAGGKGLFPPPFPGGGKAHASAEGPNLPVASPSLETSFFAARRLFIWLQM